MNGGLFKAPRSRVDVNLRSGTRRGKTRTSKHNWGKTTALEELHSNTRGTGPTRFWRFPSRTPKYLLLVHRWALLCPRSNLEASPAELRWLGLLWRPAGG